jgi:hypothetical protein
VRLLKKLITQTFLAAIAGNVLLNLITFQPDAAQTGNQTTIPEIRHNFPLDKFYDAPNRMPAGKPGDLLRSEEFDQYALPPEVNAMRILYHSRSASGQDVATSGVVLYPDGKAPAGGWPVIAWAHSLSGMGRSCAPSLARNLQHGPYLSMYVNLGYAVVATDFAGLGTTSPNAFSDIQSNAMDVIYAIPAARAALPRLSARWIAVGIGEGGPAVIGVAELESDIGDAGYLGSIAISGLDDPRQRYESPDASDYKTPLFLVYGIKTIYPQFDEKDILTDKGMQLYARVTQSCSDPARQSKYSSAEILKPGWASNNFVRQYFAQSTPGQKVSKRPILVISSEVDPSMPINHTAEIISRMCKRGDRIQFDRYAESEMSVIFGDSVGDQISWMQARFSGRPATSNCSEKP